MKKQSKTILKALLGLIVGFIAVVLLINTSLFDEKLNPEIIKLIQKQPMPPVQGNAYYALMGIKAAEGKEAIIVGHQLILRYINNRDKGNDSLNNSDQVEILDLDPDTDSIWQRKYSMCSNGNNNRYACLSESVEKLAQSPIIDQRLKFMLTRYDEIIQMKTYQNFTYSSLSTPLPPYTVLSTLSKIKLTSLYQNNDKSKFLEQLLDDINFWKMLLKDGTMVSDKMVAIREIRKDIQYLSEFIKDNTIEEKDIITIQEIITLMTAKDINLGTSFLSEYRAIYSVYQLIDSYGFSVNGLLYQPNSTQNYYFKNIIKPMLELSNLPLDQLIEHHTSGKAIIPQKNISPSGLNPSNLYNYTGKWLVYYGGALYSEYMVRGYDLNNIIKLVRIQLQDKQSDTETIEQILMRPENANPYNNQAFDYDDNTKLLGFTCLDKYSQCRIKI